MGDIQQAIDFVTKIGGGGIIVIVAFALWKGYIVFGREVEKSDKRIADLTADYEKRLAAAEARAVKMEDLAWKAASNTATMAKIVTAGPATPPQS